MTGAARQTNAERKDVAALKRAALTHRWFGVIDRRRLMQESAVIEPRYTPGDIYTLTSTIHLNTQDK